MNRLSIVTAGVVIATLVAGTSAFAQGGRRGPGPGGRSGGPDLPLAQLNLTEQQRQQVRDIQERERQDTQQLRERLQQARAAQRQAIDAMVDENQIRTATQDLAAVESDLAVQRAKLRAEVFEVLTPEQREQAAKLRAERSDRTGERRARPRERQSRGQV